MLATCSNILQIWDSQNYSVVKEFGHDHVPSTDIIKSIDWKKDNSNYLVFTYKQTGRVQLYDLQKNKSVELSTTKAQCSSFSTSGKYLSITDEDCHAQIWDVNSGRIAQTFNSVDQTPMECVCWGNGDSYVAAGTRKGNVFLYNQLTKQTFAAFTMKHGNKLGSISSIKWSPHKELIATTSNDGLLSLWNYRLKELIISIHSHKAPATDLAFSPHHDAFLVTSGMDGSLCCFDVIQQKILSTISIYAPLTSVDFHPNGSLVAVGTMGQYASVYDLRDPKNKLAHLVNSEHGNVYSVKFDIGQTTNIQRPTTLLQETNKSLSTFAQQTTRSRHTSSSSIQSTTPVDEQMPINRSYGTQPRTAQSRERSLSSLSSTTLNKLNTPTITTENSTTIDGSLSSPRQQRNERYEDKSISSVNNNDCMSFDDFTKLCGISVRSPIENGHNRANVNSSDIDESLKIMLDDRVNCLREDFKDDLNRTKLSMQMNFIVELEKLRNDLMQQIESHSLNAQLIDEIERLRTENKLLRQLQPRV
ncbi:unnamed protein product [Rotaria socialis]|uniref:WDR19 first beta-propeller domain-containing protein n=1 Tax=Rotaria socialis TaxID=392032 RepID=A0A817ZY98_9BILA|nr:unnamed protein product [Rotaria socialis]CAF3180439.1 unnamed protein product [Rotaria socialis]CAF3397804.1 unnamed protein product [Rotaria socialis]CAF3783129.1 unnamed protein product [Rotaria socialis]CAF4282459.1 unnamed protein product [Rotaria socialis]